MRLPEIQDELYKLAEAHGIPRLAELADQMSRRTSERAPQSSATLTPELKVKIRAFAMGHPTMTQCEIGQIFNVNPGRVSEIIRGKRR